MQIARARGPMWPGLHYTFFCHGVFPLDLVSLSFSLFLIAMDSNLLANYMALFLLVLAICLALDLRPFPYSFHSISVLGR